MLNNLRAEITKKGFEPTSAVAQCLSITRRTAKRKLEETADFTVPEAVKILEDFFDKEKFTFEDLFMTDKTKAG